MHALRDLNSRPADLESAALPTELKTHRTDRNVIQSENFVKFQRQIHSLSAKSSQINRMLSDDALQYHLLHEDVHAPILPQLHRVQQQSLLGMLRFHPQEGDCN